MGKRTAQKDTIIDITSDSQVNSNFPYRWSLASLTFNNYFYLFLYLYITRITINNNAPHLKPPKNQNRRAALGRPAIIQLDTIINYLTELVKLYILKLIKLIRGCTFKDYHSHLFHGFENKYFNKITLDNMLYFHN